jgi:hypothetical protein
VSVLVPERMGCRSPLSDRRLEICLDARPARSPATAPAATADGASKAGALHDPFAACPDYGGLMRRIGRTPAAHAFNCDSSR